MDLLAALFVGNPGNILMVAIVFLGGYLALAALGRGRHRRPLVIATVAWTVYACWEWLVQAETPEANIRVDLLGVWPVLAILSAWALFRACR